MAENRPGSLQLRQRTANVVEHHYDDARPGKPLYLMIPGGLVALASLALIIFIAYQTFLQEAMDQGQGTMLMLVLAPFYAGGVFLFAYGYELYDVGRAVRDTVIVVFITVASVVIVAVLFLALGSMGKGGSKSSSSSKSSSESKSSGGGIGGAVAGVMGGGSSRTLSQSTMHHDVGSLGPIFVMGSQGGTREVTHEVVREVPIAPPEPVAVKCPSCGRPYVPSETKFACPNCGAPATPEMIAESNKGIPPEDYKPVDPGTQPGAVA